MDLSKHNGMHNPFYAKRSSEKRERERLDNVHRSFYSLAIWSRLRDQTLRDNPLCVRCGVRGRTKEATTVDHVVMFMDRHDSLATDSTNLRGLCYRCHGKVSYTEKSMRYIWRKRYDDGESVDDIAMEKYEIERVAVDDSGYYL